MEPLRPLEGLGLTNPCSRTSEAPDQIRTDTLRLCSLLLDREGEDGRNIPKDGSMPADCNVGRVSNKLDLRCDGIAHRIMPEESIVVALLVGA